MGSTGYLVLESGPIFKGSFLCGKEMAGEVVFNTSHFGYEEMATDPSYYNQILVCSAPMQGNYGADDRVWESDRIAINGFVCLEMQNSRRDASWLKRLEGAGVPVLTELDTREIVLSLRDQGTVWGALVVGGSVDEAREKAHELINEKKQEPKDWVYATSCKSPYEVEGENQNGPKVAILDFGSKKNIVRELAARCSALKVFPSRAGAEEIRSWNPDGIMLSNGPGDPKDVECAADTVKELLGWKPIFGICMGHHILSLAMGGETYKLKFGHRGGNHPVKDLVLNRVYVTSQNHGYAVERESLPKQVEVTHTNLNDQTVSGLRWVEKKCMSVQFHPESCPGPNDARILFDEFVKQLM